MSISDYPERISILPTCRQKREDDFFLVDRKAFPGKGTEYVRADRIDELEAENKRLRLALEETVSLLWDDMSKQESVGKHGGYIYMKCRAALAELTGGKDE